MTTLRFSKMHGLGNDFVVIDGVTQSFQLDAQRICELADRRFGIGFDQLLLIEPSQCADFAYRIFNADGSEVGQCGNGARCAARFIQRQGLSQASTLRLHTTHGSIQLDLEHDGSVRADMGVPQLAPENIPFLAEAAETSYRRQLADGQWVEFGAVSMGNPHAVLCTENTTTAAVSELGSALQAHEDFPEGVNVGFMQCLAPDHIALRVFERGVGETLACGSGACAAVASGRLRGLLDVAVQVDLPGGTLHIEWQGPGHALLMRGPACHVFDGVLDG